MRPKAETGEHKEDKPARKQNRFRGYEDPKPPFA
jgi:hypothetical protein